MISNRMSKIAKSWKRDLHAQSIRGHTFQRISFLMWSGLSRGNTQRQNFDTTQLILVLFNDIINDQIFEFFFFNF